MDAVIAGGILSMITLIVIGYLALTIYGIVLCFQKTWYFGLIGLVVPAFATVIGAAQFIFKADLLK